MTSSKQILIAEDDSFLLSLLELQCSSMNMQTCCVENGEQLIAEALSYQYDIILTDIQMPLCDGIQAMQILRRLGYDRPIFAMSADSLDCAGFDCILQKPVDIDQLAGLCDQTPQQHKVQLQINSELTDLFYQNLAQLSQDFTTALQQQDVTTMRQICHKIKGGAASFGHMNLSQLADRMQHRLANDSPDNTLFQESRQFLLILQQSGADNEAT
ncbi:response regulator [Arsukibacterium indicum]|uniref:Response regulator n=1 Tax=Arsukibacterium indicum TaxID=2848612 RepID=A0ABS6MPX0_9GAMM|nr:response regulator [Arsukibacterium indicum]MBV2130852.1 response regulator [Arsukibacterium indicum]